MADSGWTELAKDIPGFRPFFAPTLALKRMLISTKTCSGCRQPNEADSDQPSGTTESSQYSSGQINTAHGSAQRFVLTQTFLS